MLIQHLRQLENDQLIVRESLPVVPPHVEYSLSKSGKEMGPILEAMAKWGLKNNKAAKPNNTKNHFEAMEQEVYLQSISKGISSVGLHGMQEATSSNLVFSTL